MDQIEKLLKDSIEYSKECKYCITCQHSYFNPGGYDGRCKYMKDLGNGSVYMHLKPVTTFDVCDHWEKKPDK